MDATARTLQGGDRMNDLISRQAAIDALKEAFNPSITNFVKAKMAIDNLPSAQTEERTDKRTETHACDCISRKAAIEAINKIMPIDTECDGTLLDRVDVRYVLDNMPPAEPDKDKVSDLLYHIYSIQSPHLDMNGVIAKKYYCEELWKELFGKESELPEWMN